MDDAAELGGAEPGDHELRLRGSTPPIAVAAVCYAMARRPPLSSSASMSTRMCVRTLTVLACLLSFVGLSAATVAPEQRWEPLARIGMDNDAIAGLVDAHGNVWQGGWFTYIDDARSPSVAFHDGSRWLPAGAGFNARVTAFALRPSDGAVIAAGAFTQSGADRVRGLADRELG